MILNLVKLTIEIEHHSSTSQPKADKKSTVMENLCVLHPACPTFLSKRLLASKLHHSPQWLPKFELVTNSILDRIKRKNKEASGCVFQQQSQPCLKLFSKKLHSVAFNYTHWRLLTVREIRNTWTSREEKMGFWQTGHQRPMTHFAF